MGRPRKNVSKRLPRRRTKRARIGDGSSTVHGPDWRDWASLACGPATLIADRVLSGDVADYIRFRGVCSAWRRCTADPRADVLDRRFYPRYWAMLPDVYLPRRRGRGGRPRYHYSRFANVYTKKEIHMTIRGLYGRAYLARTSQGLLVLLGKNSDEVWVLNPITGAFADLPTVTTLLEDYARAPEEVRFSAEVTDDSAVMINIAEYQQLAVARPGDEDWTKLESES